ncbi:MAG: hypothetical protein P0Y53_18715 [Candidatus Pseudobacter hemicellulosilyticus]|uniref:Uncharacterized protein n=1 Tax=Candidatus Pseudobacter hemicellulosilyticus TaxID=3121375 RepID=A0AAJ5WNS9_9BACT|nr:MAG: hypothetical protein P0Y53_18715 [Pseudobacter sp.]
MKITLQYKEFTIKVFDDPSFTEESDSPTSYDYIYQPEKDKIYRPVSQHAIIVYQDNVKYASSILLASAGATTILSDSALIDDDNLITRCCNTIFCLTLPQLNLNWMKEADWATCFSIHRYQNSYIIHGETSITRIDKSGNLLWSYSGADIFVCLYEGDPFKMYDNYIALTDWNGGKYEVGYDGETISYKP